MRINSTWANRLQSVPLGKAVFSLLLMGNNVPFTGVAKATPTVAERVSLIRQSLAAKQGSLTPDIGARSLGDDSKSDTQMAQFPNWGNWANWANWNNWQNWANWASWINF